MSNIDSGNTPVPNSNEPKNSADIEQLVTRFRLKAVELARQGVLGSLRTRVATLQTAWSTLVSFLDEPSVPVMLYGERGTGKRKLVEEFMLLDNFSRKIEGKPMLKLKVYRGDYAVPGFTQQLLPGSNQPGTIIYLEHVDRLGASLQEELLRHYEIRKQLASKGIDLPRLVLSTERALSLQVIQGRFSKNLFQALTQFAIFLPSLNERGEDMPALISAISKEVCGRVQLPTAEIMNRFSVYMWPDNMDELRKVVENMLAKNPEMQQWKYEDLPRSLQPFKTLSFERMDAKSLATHYGDRNKLKTALKKTLGNQNQAAASLGMSRKEFLEQMLRFGVR